MPLSEESSAPSGPSAIGYVSFHGLPVAALLTEGGTIVDANAAYERLMRRAAKDIIGLSVSVVISETIAAEDRRLVRGAHDGYATGAAPEGEIWCRVVDGLGQPRTVRAMWQRAAAPRPRNIVYLVDAESDARERELAAVLATIGAELLRCRDEQSVLARAADALFAHGYTSTFLLIREGDPLLEYGPSRGPRPDVRASLAAARPPRAVLEGFNPHFSERRAAFFHQTEIMVRAAYDRDAAERLNAALPGNRTVQAPLFVDDAPYGAMVVTDNRLTPVSCGTLEVFAQVVGAAVENARLHERAAARLEELSRLQSELVQRERLAALGEAAAVMAHEVRNPIAAILNAVTLLTRHPLAAAATRELHEVIAEEAERLDRIVGDLLAMGRPMIPRPRSVNLADLAASAFAILKSRKESASCELDPVVVEGDPHAFVDPDLVLLAVLNVVRNAVQASPEGGHVHVTVRAEDATRLLVVEDQGPGLPDDVAQRMFEPFFTTRATGTGVGLAVVRRVVDAHGGSVEVGHRPAGGGRIALRFAAPAGED